MGLTKAADGREMTAVDAMSISHLSKTYLDSIIRALSATINVDLGAIHKSHNVNFRLCDYTPQHCGCHQ